MGRLEIIGKGGNRRDIGTGEETKKDRGMKSGKRSDTRKWSNTRRNGIGSDIELRCRIHASHALHGGRNASRQGVQACSK